ncbi:MAG: SDR family oxidoreductase [Actinobacteria bacterium]|nr:SDR family oxidoreductase [Actinomycetota bacterium]MCL5736768.1 SDR family oxidoreductase [Actinomycetota bacterium]
MRLNNKIAIITGTAGGMGQAAAILFAQEGAKVAAVDLTDSLAQPTVDQIRKEGGQAIAIGADITRTEDVKRIAQRTVDELGLPNVLFNNAGVDLEQKKPMIEIDEEAFDRTIEVNLKGTWLLMKHVVPHMIKAGGGSIINTASVGAFIPVGSAGYIASKAGVVALTRVAANELGRYNIRVNSLCPGMTMTPMAAQQVEEMIANGIPMESILAMRRRLSVLGRMGEPIEMAKMGLFLASDDSSYATGASFNNDGGLTIVNAVETRS